MKIAGKPRDHEEKLGGYEISMARIITIKHEFATLIIDCKAVSSDTPASIICHIRAAVELILVKIKAITMITRKIMIMINIK